MSVISNKARLSASTRELASQWALAKESWRDVKCQEFELKYMEQLVANVDAAMDVIDRLDKLISKIRSDCE
jgi:hypothetical protein